MKNLVEKSKFLRGFRKIYKEKSQMDFQGFMLGNSRIRFFKKFLLRNPSWFFFSSLSWAYHPTVFLWYFQKFWAARIHSKMDFEFPNKVILIFFNEFLLGKDVFDRLTHLSISQLRSLVLKCDVRKNSHSHMNSIRTANSIV